MLSNNLNMKLTNLCLHHNRLQPFAMSLLLLPHHGNRVSACRTTRDNLSLPLPYARPAERSM